MVAAATCVGPLSHIGHLSSSQEASLPVREHRKTSQDRLAQINRELDRGYVRLREMEKIIKLRERREQVENDLNAASTSEKPASEPVNRLTQLPTGQRWEDALTQRIDRVTEAMQGDSEGIRNQETARLEREKAEIDRQIYNGRQVLNDAVEEGGRQTSTEKAVKSSAQSMPSLPVKPSFAEESKGKIEKLKSAQREIAGKINEPPVSPNPPTKRDTLNQAASLKDRTESLAKSNAPSGLGKRFSRKAVEDRIPEIEKRRMELQVKTLEADKTRWDSWQEQLKNGDRLQQQLRRVGQEIQKRATYLNAVQDISKLEDARNEILAAKSDEVESPIRNLQEVAAEESSLRRLGSIEEVSPGLTENKVRALELGTTSFATEILPDSYVWVPKNSPSKVPVPVEEGTPRDVKRKWIQAVMNLQLAEFLYLVNAIFSKNDYGKAQVPGEGTVAERAILFLEWVDSATGPTFEEVKKVFREGIPRVQKIDSVLLLQRRE